MSALTWRRVGAFGSSLLAAALTLVAVRSAISRYERDLAERSAATIAAYLAIAAPPQRGGSDYDLAQLLIQARALTTLLGLPQVEVYNRTAPLVHAVAPPLSPAELDRLRREETMGWDGSGALAPLLDREGWEVVGAVRAPRPHLEPRWVQRVLPALLLISLGFALLSVGAAGKVGVQQRALVLHLAAAVVVGCAAYLAVRAAAKRATDQWLAETGAMVQEATTHSPGGLDVADVAPIVRGATLVAADIVKRGTEARRLNRGGVASVVVRMGGGRWAELRTRAAEAETGVWFLCTIGLALFGPAGIWLATRSTR
jgi:hypothetical protein